MSYAFVCNSLKQRKKQRMNLRERERERARQKKATVEKRPETGGRRPWLASPSRTNTWAGEALTSCGRQEMVPWRQACKLGGRPKRGSIEAEAGGATAREAQGKGCKGGGGQRQGQEGSPGRTYCHRRKVCRGLPERRHRASSGHLPSHGPGETRNRDAHYGDARCGS